MRIAVDLLPDVKAPDLPDSVATTLRKVEGPLSAENLANLEDPEDSNLDTVGEYGGCDIVADGTAAVRVIVDGLSRRLQHPVIAGETLRLV